MEQKKRLFLSPHVMVAIKIHRLILFFRNRLDYASSLISAVERETEKQTAREDARIVSREYFKT